VHWREQYGKYQWLTIFFLVRGVFSSPFACNKIKKQHRICDACRGIAWRSGALWELPLSELQEIKMGIRNQFRIIVFCISIANFWLVVISSTEFASALV
jgi:hypothetical protein